MKKSAKSVEKKPATRSISASEIARNVKHFETWSSCQACEQVAFSDLPFELKDEVVAVFDVERRLPVSLVRECSSSGQLATLAPELASFIRKVNREAPSLFTDRDDLPLSSGIFSELNAVFLAWKRLHRMRKLKEKWSESDFAANVYNVFRTPAVRISSCRNQCTISLPERLPHIPLTASSQRVTRAKSVVPDSAIFIHAHTIRALSLSKHSPYKRLSSNPKVRKHCTTDAAFRFQSSPRAQPPENPSFEFVSSFWEDKKPNCDFLDVAYRQNRMATTAGVRHLGSFGIQAPVFGLVWASGTVRAHVDWCAGEGEQMVIQSAPYPGPQPISSEGISANTTTTPNTSICTASSTSSSSTGPIFHEWSLDRPSDILRVFLLIRNIDAYTAGPFRTRVEDGLNALVERMERGVGVYRPWKVTAESAGVLKTRVNTRANASVTVDASAPCPDTVHAQVQVHAQEIHIQSAPRNLPSSLPPTTTATPLPIPIPPPSAQQAQAPPNTNTNTNARRGVIKDVPVKGKGSRTMNTRTSSAIATECAKLSENKTGCSSGSKEPKPKPKSKSRGRKTQEDDDDERL